MITAPSAWPFRPNRLSENGNRIFEDFDGGGCLADDFAIGFDFAAWLGGDEQPLEHDSFDLRVPPLASQQEAGHGAQEVPAVRAGADRE